MRVLPDQLQRRDLVLDFLDALVELLGVAHVAVPLVQKEIQGLRAVPDIVQDAVPDRRLYPLPVRARGQPLLILMSLSDSAQRLLVQCLKFAHASQSEARDEVDREGGELVDHDCIAEHHLRLALDGTFLFYPDQDCLIQLAEEADREGKGFIGDMYGLVRLDQAGGTLLLNAVRQGLR